MISDTLAPMEPIKSICMCVKAHFRRSLRTSLKCCCSFSFAKLMQNCSKLWNKSVNQLMGGSVEMKIFDSVNKREKKKEEERETR